MPDQLMQSIGQNEQGAQQELIQRLLTRVAQPRMVGPQPQPEMVKASQPRQYDPAQGLVHNLFGLIATSAQHNKEVQEAHAFSRINSINAAITRSYDEAQRQLEKGDITEDQVKNVAFDLLLKMPEAKSLLSKEGQKDMKQMEKLLQQDFLNPEKNRTVWHTALEKVAKVAGAEKLMSGIKALMGKHKDKMAEEVRKQGEAQHKQAEGKELLKNMMEMSNTQQADPSKILPSLVSSTGADLRQKERLLHQDWRDEQNRELREKIDGMKNPIDKANAKAFAAMNEGNQEEAQKYLDMAHKMAEAKSVKQANPSSIVDTMLHDPDPKKRQNAKEVHDQMMADDMKKLLARGASFRINQYVDDDGFFGEPGKTITLNGLEVEHAQNAGHHLTLVGPINPQLLVAAQQVMRSMNSISSETGKSLRDELVDDMGVFDNEKDKAIIARVLRENPNVYSQDLSTLGVWLDQNLTGQLSENGQKLMRHLQLYAEAFRRMLTTTGQPATQANTDLLLAILPNEKTPTKAYGMQKLLASYDFIDGMLGAPILGGGKLGGGTTPKKPATDKTDPNNPLGLNLPH